MMEGNEGVFEDYLKAANQAKSICNFWLNQGYAGISTSVELDEDLNTYLIRSNIGSNGYPPKS